MKLLSEKDAATLRDYFAQEMVETVTLRLFVQDPTKAGNGEHSAEAEQIAEEITELTDKVKLVVHKYPTDEDEVKQYNIERVPALVLEREYGVDSGVRFYGAPSGFEFSTLIEDIAELSSGDSKLSPELRKHAEQVERPVTIKVFVTPT